MQRFRDDGRKVLHSAEHLAELLRDHPTIAVLDSRVHPGVAFWCESAPWAARITVFEDRAARDDFAVPRGAVPAVIVGMCSWSVRETLRDEVSRYLDAYGHAELAALAAAYAAGGSAGWRAATAALRRQLPWPPGRGS